jgi:hypothetical protein
MFLEYFGRIGLFWKNWIILEKLDSFGIFWILFDVFGLF